MVGCLFSHEDLLYYASVGFEFIARVSFCGEQNLNWVNILFWGFSALKYTREALLSAHLLNKDINDNNCLEREFLFACKGNGTFFEG
jgi:hypothetical protein